MMSLTKRIFLITTMSFIGWLSDCKTDPSNPNAQTLDAHLEQLRGTGTQKIYRGRVTGAPGGRPELLKLLDHLAAGDLVTVTRIALNLFVIVKQIVDAKSGSPGRTERPTRCSHRSRAPVVPDATPATSRPTGTQTARAGDRVGAAGPSRGGRSAGQPRAAGEVRDPAVAVRAHPDWVRYGVTVKSPRSMGCCRRDRAHYPTGVTGRFSLSAAALPVCGLFRRPQSARVPSTCAGLPSIRRLSRQ